MMVSFIELETSMMGLLSTYIIIILNITQDYVLKNANKMNFDFSTHQYQSLTLFGEWQWYDEFLGSCNSGLSKFSFVLIIFFKLILLQRQWHTSSLRFLMYRKTDYYFKRNCKYQEQKLEAGDLKTYFVCPT